MPIRAATNRDMEACMMIVVDMLLLSVIYRMRLRNMQAGDWRANLESSESIWSMRFCNEGSTAETSVQCKFER